MNDNQNGEELAGRIFNVDAMSAEERLKTSEMVAHIVEDRKLKVTALAEEAGVDRKTLRTMLSGARAPQADVLRKVLEAVGLTQVGDFDQKYSERTRMFMASVAPIFEQLPQEAKEEAQHDVTVLLTGKLARATNNHGVVSNFEEYRRRNVSAVEDTEQFQEEAAAAFDAHKLGTEEDGSEFF